MENKKQEELKTKNMSEREQKVAERSAEKKISKEDAEKEVARESVKEKTGYDANALAEVGRSTLNTKDALERPDLKEASKEMERIQGNAVGDMLEKMTDGKVAEDVVKAGLGSAHLSTGKSGLEQGARTVLEKMNEFGSASDMRQLLADAALYGNGMSIEDAKNMTPEVLREKVEALKEKAPKIPTQNAPAKESKPAEKREVNLAMLRKKQEQR